MVEDQLSEHHDSWQDDNHCHDGKLDMKGSNTQKPDLEMGIKVMGCPKPNLDGTGDHYSLSKINTTRVWILHAYRTHRVRSYSFNVILPLYDRLKIDDPKAAFLHLCSNPLISSTLSLLKSIGKWGNMCLTINLQQHGTFHNLACHLTWISLPILQSLSLPMIGYS